MLGMGCAYPGNAGRLGLFGEFGFEVQIARLKPWRIGIGNIPSQYFSALRAQSECRSVESQSIVESDFQMRRLNANYSTAFIAIVVPIPIKSMGTRGLSGWDVALTPQVDTYSAISCRPNGKRLPPCQIYLSVSRDRNFGAPLICTTFLSATSCCTDMSDGHTANRFLLPRFLLLIHRAAT